MRQFSSAVLVVLADGANHDRTEIVRDAKNRLSAAGTRRRSRRTRASLLDRRAEPDRSGQLCVDSIAPMEQASSGCEPCKRCSWPPPPRAKWDRHRSRSLAKMRDILELTDQEYEAAIEEALNWESV